MCKAASGIPLEGQAEAGEIGIATLDQIYHLSRPVAGLQHGLRWEGETPMQLACSVLWGMPSPDLQLPDKQCQQM